ncbi:potassium channel subfamily K member 9-like [Acanthaster planci]|uniref:Potassium channel subfamily K member 9-like n=1 Tax=Acanthaster planci TaxID=133434 RepID=A0A8B7ZG20_ACAPL|nr:potassium channel subfamily K member 9-like [Acanthaster planci]
MKAWIKCLLLLACTCSYIVLGGVTFIALEHEEPIRVQRELTEAVASFVANNSCCGVTDETLRDFLEEVVIKANENGVFWSKAHPATGLKEVWVLSNAFQLSFEVVTTIGQGLIVPRTFRGRLFCMFYAIFGVPLCYLMLTTVGDTCYFMWRKLRRLFSRIRRRSIRLTLGVPCTLFVLYLVLVTIPATFVGIAEGWNYFTSEYYCFMIMSTVGLGDLSRKAHSSDSVMMNWIRKVFSVIYDFVCLGIISVILKGINEYRKEVRSHREAKRLKKETGKGEARNVSFIPYSVDQLPTEQGLSTSQDSEQDFGCPCIKDTGAY